MLKLILILIVAAAATIIVLALRRPDHFRVERSQLIRATPEQIYPHIADLRRWAAWSVWEGMDPAMRKTYSPNTTGVGASYEWKGNRKVGHGRMTLVELMPPTKVVIQLDFIAPFEAHNTATLTLKPHGANTLVTWEMYGPLPFISKLFSVFVSMDKMIGKDFESCLTNLETVVKKSLSSPR